MSYSQSKKAAIRRLTARKKPSQARSAQTVEAILEGAAHILEHHGLDGYTTNAIAVRAGVSIGSLYQYFPTKDAITTALIERESVSLVAEANAALLLPHPRETLRVMIEAAVRHQLRRPILAKLLDFEQNRLSQIMPPSQNAQALSATVLDFLTRHLGVDNPIEIAGEMMSITRALTDAAGRRKGAIPSEIERRVEAALFGYLCAVAGEKALSRLGSQNG